MALIDMWTSAPEQLEDKKVEQVIKFAGSGRLLDGNDCSNEFRQFLRAVPARLLTRYAEECLSEKFDDGGGALQDVLNEVGRRIGFDVTNGRYRGAVNQIGHDGLWRTHDNYAIVVETKTTSAYQIRLAAVVGYRKSLVASAAISEEDSSILIIVGREDTGDLEAQIRGSRHAWDVRLISVDAMLRLMALLNEDVDDPRTVLKVRQVLVPREFTKVDGIVDLVFSATEDVRFSEDPGDLGEVEPETHPKFTPVKFHDNCIERIERYLNKRLLKRSRATFSTADGDLVVICAVSKEHLSGANASYWFAFHPHYKEALEAGSERYVAFGCGSAQSTLLIPADTFFGWLPSMYVTRRDERMYWHVRIFREEKRFVLHGRTGQSHVDLSEYILATTMTAAE